MKHYIFFITALLLISCSTQDSEKSIDTGSPENIILMIGDGMGLSQVSTSFYYKDSSNFDRFADIGLMNTSSASHRITDSGAGGTALAVGERTFNGAIGVGSDSLPRQNMVEILSEKDFLTGIIATSQVTHATPASFYAHVPSRYMEEDIAVQLLHSEVDFFAAGGIKYFTHRSDGINYYDSLLNNGFVLDTTTLRTNLTDKNKYGFLLAPDAMPSVSDGRGNFLPEATKLAIDCLSDNNKGFFLMVEGSQIDWAGHDNNASYLLDEMNDFDNAIGVALDFAEKNKETLVIVTADHETGGLTLAATYANRMSGNYNKIDPLFSTTGHSAALVPVFAYGPGSENFKGIYRNNEILSKIMGSLR